MLLRNSIAFFTYYFLRLKQIASNETAESNSTINTVSFLPQPFAGLGSATGGTSLDHLA